MRILIAQMTRMGDMLQTTPLIRVIKRVHPDAHITVMVRRMGEIIAKRNPNIDDVIIYDEDAMYLHLRSGDSNRLLEAYRLAEAYVRQLKEGQFDEAYNCTQSISSVMLLKLAEIPKIIGAQLNPHYEYVIDGRGPACFFASALHRELSDLNLCDVFRRFGPIDNEPAPLQFEVYDDDRNAAESLLHDRGIAPDDFLVCMQLGASDRDKRWPPESFAALARKLVDERNAKVLLVGVESEAPLGAEFAQHAPGLAVPLFGETSVPVLAAILERSRVLVTNDTGTMHIAAAVRCPIVLMSVGYVHFRETGPYAAGCCALERRRSFLGRSDFMRSDPHGRVGIDPENAFQAVNFVIDGAGREAWPRYEERADFGEVDVYQSGYAPDGCLEWYSLVRRPVRITDLTRQAYRLMWLDYLGTGVVDEAERASLIELSQCFADPIPDDLADWVCAVSDDFELLAEKANTGVVWTNELIAGLDAAVPMKWAQGVVAKLMRLDQEIRLFGDVHEACRPLVMLTRFERENLQGADPRVLAETTLGIYRNLVERARLAAAKTRTVGEVWTQTKVNAPRRHALG